MTSYRLIDAKSLLKFLEANEPKLYKKYSGYGKHEFSSMNTPSIPAEQKVVMTFITKIALYEGYQHGDVIEFMEDSGRGRDYFYWDSLKEKPIPPCFDHGDATLPENFLIGDGFFSPHHWGRGWDWHPKRPSKALLKEVKTHFSKSDDPLEVTINGKKYTVKKDPDGDWKDYNWNKLMMINDNFTNTLIVDSHYTSEGKAVNEEKLHALLNGDNTKRNQTRKMDLEAKLKVAVKKLEDAQAEVDRLRRELDAVGKRGTRRA